MATDDTAIAQSWDRIVNDYKIFNDIRARGGSVDDLPAENRLHVEQDAKHETNRRADHSANDLSPKLEHPPVLKPRSPRGTLTQHGAGNEEGPPRPPETNPSLLPPSAVLNASSGDNSLKKLLMSWYYAGYYTGLYEGQQQAQQARQDNDRPDDGLGDADRSHEGQDD